MSVPQCARAKHQTLTPNVWYGAWVKHAPLLAAVTRDALTQKTERLAWHMHTYLADQMAMLLETVELVITTVCIGFQVIRSYCGLFGVIRASPMLGYSKLFGIMRRRICGNP